MCKPALAHAGEIYVGGLTNLSLKGVQLASTTGYQAGSMTNNWVVKSVHTDPQPRP